MEHLRRIVCPTTQSSYAKCLAHPEHIVAKAGSFLLGIGVELSLLQFECLAVFAIDIHSLSLVEIDAVCHHFVFEGWTVVVEHPIGVGAVIYGETADVEILLVAALNFLVGEHHLCIDLRLVSVLGSFAAQLNPEGLFLSFVQ